MLSRRDTIKGYLSLLDSLAITRDEAINANLDIRYDETLNNMIWNEEYDSPKEVSFQPHILEDLKNWVSLLSSSVAREVSVKLAGIRN